MRPRSSSGKRIFYPGAKNGSPAFRSRRNPAYVVHPLFRVAFAPSCAYHPYQRFPGHRRELGQPPSGFQTYSSLRLPLQEFLLGLAVSEG